MFAVLTTYSIWNIYSTHQRPLYTNETKTICEYYFNGAYDYTAKLKENLLYNTTTLKPGEGVLYSSIVDHVNLTFIHTIDIKPKPSNLSHETTIEAKLESPNKWIRSLTETETKRLLFLIEGQGYDMILDLSNIQDIVDQIDFETGTYSSSYNLTILPKVNVRGQISDKDINDTFINELPISFISGGKMGNYLKFGELQKTSYRKFTREIERYSLEVEFQRQNSYLQTALFFSVFTVSTIIYFKIKSAPIVSHSKEDETLDEYKDLLYETSDKPLKTENTVFIDTLNELVKTAEILQRPIFHKKDENTQIFYIIDIDTKYQYKTIE